MTETPSTFVVAYDGSYRAETALKALVARTSSCSQGTIHVVMVVEAVEGKIAMPDGSVVERWTALDTLRLTIAEMVRAWGNKAPGFRISAHLRSGQEAAAVIKLAQQVKADEIVVAADALLTRQHERGLAESLLKRSSIPVHVDVNALQIFSGQQQNFQSPRPITPETQADLSINTLAMTRGQWLQ